MSSSQYDDALVLCALNRGKTNEMDTSEYQRKENAIHLSYANHLYKTRQFSRCREEYLLSSCDSRVVLSLFVPLLPEGVDFSDYFYDTENGSRSSGGSGSSGSSGGSGEVIDKNAITNLLIPFLIYTRTSVVHVEEKDSTSPNNDSSSSSSSSSSASYTHPSQIPVPRTNTLPVHLDEVIDTVLLKAYIFTNAPLVDVVDFLTGGGCEDHDSTQVRVPLWLECRALVDESEDLLSGIAEKWEELIWFYFSKGESFFF